MPLARDSLHPSEEEEKKQHKKKRLVQSSNSCFVDVRSPQRSAVLLCVGCSTVLCQSTGGKARLPGGRSFRKKQH
ncbi:small ribosomal subunit protein eS27-like [Ochotona princeps]|uniref:small ribosomal subunit protein eS27-like n=1 Tax=Ochotona princeps TaxID=9978 RepID=UPI0027152B71|nr:small ribosomal subunit protein eS27-like [Ochotona princeps]